MTTSFPTFPLAGVSWPDKKTLGGSSIRQVAISGKRTILPQMVDVRYSWELTFEALRSALWSNGSLTDLETFVGFYLAQSMAGTCFSYADAEDNAVTGQGFGVGDNTTTAFQLVRARGGFAEKVLLPTITGLTVAGVAKTSPTDYTLGDKGIVTFTSAPAAAAALQWTGSFKWLCRFDSDTVDFERFMLGLTSVKSITFSNEINP